MSEDPAERQGVGESWSTYWSGAGNAQAWAAGGSAHPAVLAFWQEVLTFARDLKSAPRLLDIASGSGAVVSAAMEIFTDPPAAVTCVDISPAAIGILGERFPVVEGIVADAAALPLEAGGFDVVTSQFGVEYAGSNALDEALRMVGRRGLLALLVHHRDGVIHRRCRASRDAIAELRRADFVPRALAMFEAGFAALQEKGEDDALRRRYAEAGRALAPAIRRIEGILSNYGAEIADGTVLRLYRDVRDIHGGLARYDASEVLEWLGRMQDELAAYHGRMASMCDAAIDESAFRDWCARAGAAGLDLLRAEPLAGQADDAPLAWALVARRR